MQNQNLNGQSIVFCLHLVMKMLMIMILTVLFLLSKIENNISLLQLYQQETIKSYENFLSNNLKDHFIGINIKQKVRTKKQQININIFSNQNLLEAIDYLFQFIRMKIMPLKDLKLKDIIYQKELLIIIMSSSIEKTFMIN